MTELDSCLAQRQDRHKLATFISLRGNVTECRAAARGSEAGEGGRTDGMKARQPHPSSGDEGGGVAERDGDINDALADALQWNAHSASN
ncbi:hypothetical protein E2C01_038885 [Portunus trituberculatus]|uniref:Uncharacterized protein n=1 Tax=Portunus trituberculatus TaxID=210409 RepID=A0A5B7FI53_PORTR|nr:hypothetical protein [Portunus trituberculatus]